MIRDIPYTQILYSVYIRCISSHLTSVLLQRTFCEC